MNTLTIAAVACAILATASAGNVGLVYGHNYGGYGLGYGGYGLGYGLGGGYGATGVGSSVAILSGGPAFTKAVAGPAFLVKTVHHVNKLHNGGALIAHSGLGSGYGGYGGYGYGGYGYKW
ncbi:uncharacterized protein LOC142803502 [Rhipicephalus microplus]|uniref:uncharacterized protein LOC142803502 n=1 Tax=Rhipicephalus microplus TaxID=6941 RepID=UPI003F6A78A1